MDAQGIFRFAHIRMEGAAYSTFYFCSSVPVRHTNLYFFFTTILGVKRKADESPAAASCSSSSSKQRRRSADHQSRRYCFLLQP